MSLRIGRLVECLNKTISMVVVRSKIAGDNAPGDQLFLVFDDGTYLEIFGDLQNGSVHEGDADYVKGYAKRFGEDVEVLGDS